MINIKVELNINKDAWNWWHACNKISHGVDWKKRISPILWKKIYKKTEKEAYYFLIPYLKNYYKAHKKELNKSLKQAEKLFNSQAKASCKLMEQVTKHKIYRKNFTCFLTTFPRCPYVFSKGYIWLCAIEPSKCYLATFLHELMHFQFIYYYKEDPIIKKLSENQYQKLKESLTFLLNYKFKKYLHQKEKGYKIYEKFTLKLEKFWIEHKDFDLLINYGSSLLIKK